MYMIRRALTLMNQNSVSYEQGISPIGCMNNEIAHCAGHISANGRPYQLCWGDRERAYDVHKIIIIIKLYWPF